MDRSATWACGAAPRRATPPPRCTGIVARPAPDRPMRKVITHILGAAGGTLARRWAIWPATRCMPFTALDLRVRPASWRSPRGTTATVFKMVVIQFSGQRSARAVNWWYDGGKKPSANCLAASSRERR